MMSDCDDIPELVNSSGDESLDIRCNQDLQKKIKMVSKIESMEEQELWMRIFCFGPFLFGVNNILSESWIRALLDAELLLNENQQNTISFFKCLDLMDDVITEVQKFTRDFEMLHNCLNQMQKLSSFKTDNVVDVETAIAEGEEVTEVASIWRKIMNDQVVDTKRERASKFAVLYVLWMYLQPDLFYGGKSSDFIKQTKENVQRQNSAMAEKCNEKGNDHFKGRRYEEAICCYTEAAELEPFNHAYYCNRSKAYLKLNKYEEAMADSRRSVIIKPDFAKGYYRYAKALHSLGELDTAIKVNQKGLNLCRKDEKHELVKQGDEFAKEKSRKNNPLMLLPKELSEKPESLPVKNSDSVGISEMFNGNGIMNHSVADCNDIDPQINSSKAADEQTTSNNEADEFMSLLRKGSSNMLQFLYKPAMESYKKALDMMSESKRFGLNDMDTIVLRYAYSLASIHTDIYKNIQDGKQILQEIVDNKTDIRFPTAYFGIGKAYIMLNKFSEALEPLKQGLTASNTSVSLVPWPGTNTWIEETNTDVLKIKLKELIQLCKCPPPPDAICRYQPDSADHQAAIYKTDPNFKGYIALVCQMDCTIYFHKKCWSMYKLAINKQRNGDVLHTNCMTPDCTGVIIRIDIIHEESTKSLTEKIPDVKENMSKKPVIKPKAASKPVKKSEKKDKQKKKKHDDTNKNKPAESLITDSASAVTFIEDLENATYPLPDVKDTMVLTKDDDDDKQKGSMAEKGKKLRKKKSKNKQILPVEVNFSDQREATLLNEYSVISDDEGSQFSKSHMFSVPSDLKGQINSFEKNYVKPVKYMLKNDAITENLFSFFAEILLGTGPLAIDDPRIVSEMKDFPQEAKDRINQVGGLTEFLKQSLKFAIIDNVISLMSDAKRAREIALLHCSGKESPASQTVVQNSWKTVSNSVKSTNDSSENKQSLIENVKTSANISSTLPHNSPVPFTASSLIIVTTSLINSSYSNSSYTVSSLQSSPVSTFAAKKPLNQLLVKGTSATVKTSLKNHPGDSLDSIDDFAFNKKKTSTKSMIDELDDIEINYKIDLKDMQNKLSSSKSIQEKYPALTDSGMNISNESHHKLTNDASNLVLNRALSTQRGLNTQSGLGFNNIKKYSNIWDRNENESFSYTDLRNEMKDTRNDLTDYISKEKQKSGKDIPKPDPFISIKKHYEKSDEPALLLSSPVNAFFPQKPSLPMDSLGSFSSNDVFNSALVDIHDSNQISMPAPILSSSVTCNPTSDPSNSRYNLFSGPSWGIDSFNNFKPTKENPAIIKPINSLRPPQLSAFVYQDPLVSLPSKSANQLPPPIYMPHKIGTPLVQITKMDEETQMACEQVTVGVMTELYEPFKEEYLQMKQSQELLVNHMKNINEKLKDKERHVMNLEREIDNILQMYEMDKATWKVEREGFQDQILKLNEQITTSKNTEKELKEKMAGKEKMVNEMTMWVKNQRDNDSIEMKKCKENVEKYRHQFDVQRELAKAAELEILQTNLKMAKALLEKSRHEAQYNCQNLQGYLKKLEDDKMTIPASLKQAVDFWSSTVEKCEEILGQLQTAYEEQISEIRGGKSLSELPTIRPFSPPLIPDTMKDLTLLMQCPPSNFLFSRMPFNIKTPTFNEQGIPNTTVALLSSKSAAPSSETSSSYNSNPPPPIALPSVPKPLTMPYSSGSGVMAPLRPIAGLRQLRPPLRLPMGNGQLQHISSSHKLFMKLQRTFPNKSRDELKELIKDLRSNRGGSLTGMTMEDISVQIKELILRKEQPNLLASYGKPSAPPPGFSSSWAFSVHESEDQNSISGRGLELYHEDEELCVICHEELNTKAAVELHCGHNFHDECIRKWFLEQSTCPNCRVHSLLSDEFPSLV